MAYKHPLVPAVHSSTDKVYRFSPEANICNTCNLPDSKCSYRCKRYKEELAKLRKGGSSGNSNGEPD